MNDEALDRQLREALPYIGDNDFTARVLSRLPAPRRERQSLRHSILLGLTLLGSALAYFVSDSARFVVVSIVRVANMPVTSVLIITFGIGLLAIGAAFVAGLAKLQEART